MGTETTIIIAVVVILAIIGIFSIIKKPRTITGTIYEVKYVNLALGQPVTTFKVDTVKGKVYAFGVQGYDYRFTHGKLIQIWPSTRTIARTRTSKMVRLKNGTEAEKPIDLVWYAMEMFRFIDEDKT